MNDDHRKSRLRHLIKTDYGRQVDFDRATGLGKSRVSQLVGNTEPFGEEAARRLADQIGLPTDWFNLSLPTPKEAKRPVENNQSPAPGGIAPPAGSIAVNQSKLRSVFVVGRANGGLMPERIWTDGDYPVGATDECADVATADPEAFLTKVEGPSMIPRYNPNEYALVEPGTEPELEDDVLVRLATGQTMIKRLLSRRDGYRFGSYNDPEVKHFRADEVTWVYYIAHPVPRRKIKARC